MTDEEAKRERREAVVAAKTEVSTALQLLRSAMSRMVNVGLGVHPVGMSTQEATKRAEVADALVDQLLVRLP